MEGRDRGENNAGEKEECKEQKIQGGILMERGTTEKGRDREGQRTREGREQEPMYWCKLEGRQRERRWGEPAEKGGREEGEK